MDIKTKFNIGSCVFYIRNDKIERNFKLLNTRVAYSSPYEAWIGILESTLKNYVIPKR